jgi:hypothetical protein
VDARAIASGAERVLKFENATLHFYRGLRDVLGASPTLDVMIGEEKRHAVEVMRAISDAEARSQHRLAPVAADELRHPGLVSS